MGRNTIDPYNSGMNTHSPSTSYKSNIVMVDNLISSESVVNEYSSYCYNVKL
jgi:hypothetical protein